jgi:magnesium chelatase subunit D
VNAPALSDAQLALHLFVRSPALFGGIVLRGPGPGREAMVAFAAQPVPRLIRIPATIDTDRLLGGIDLSATLAAGRSVRRPGLLAEAAGGVLLIPMAERLAPGIAAHVAQAMDGGTVGAILLDDGAAADEVPPALLAERAAFLCDVADERDFAEGHYSQACPHTSVAPISEEQRRALAVTALALGIASLRPLLFAQAAARAHAALHGRRQCADEDVAAAVRLVLAPRATQLPQLDPPLPNPDPSPPDHAADDHDGESPLGEDRDLDDILLEAAAAAIPAHLLDQLAGSARRGSKGQAGKAGQKQQSALRGRPLAARAGMPGHGRRLASDAGQSPIPSPTAFTSARLISGSVPLNSVARA